jgi:Cu(I)/Ag(I) efflux system membrane fusion protein
MVKTGTENRPDGRNYAGGLPKGDRSVTAGAYLLHSEYTLRKGADPMAAHDHSKTTYVSRLSASPSHMSHI